MSFASPMSMITAMPVFGSESVIVCASRSSAQALSAGCSFRAMKFASWTKPKGNSPWPQSSRQFLIIEGNSVWYSFARLALDSPWYHTAPLMP